MPTISTRSLRHFALAAAAGLVAAAATAATPYRIADIGPGRAFALNDAGQVTGADGSGEAFLFTPRSGMLVFGPPGPRFSAGNAINDRGEVTGSYHPFGNSTIHAFRFSVATGLVDVGTLGGEFSEGRGINHAGQVVGSSFHENATRAFLANRHSSPFPLGTLAGDGAGPNHHSVATAINDAGVVTGWSSRADFVRRAFVWSAGAGMQEINGAIGNAINNAGQVTGGSAGGEAFLHSPGSGSIVLGKLGGISSEGFGINDAGDVVGDVAFAGTTVRTPFLYTAEDGMVDLHSLLDRADRNRWRLEAAVDINNSGQIAGYGLLNGVQHAFVMTPVPEPGTWALMLAGLAALGVVRWRRRASPAAAVPA